MFIFLRPLYNKLRFKQGLNAYEYTVKRVDEVVRHPHLVTQDQFTQVSKKVSDIPEENFTINMDIFDRIFQMSNFFGRNGSSEK